MKRQLEKIWRGLMFCLVVGLMFYAILSDGTFCSESENFFQNSLSTRLLSFEIDTLSYKGINYHYYFDNERSIELIKNSKSYNTTLPDLQIGDTIVKQATRLVSKCIEMVPYCMRAGKRVADANTATNN